MYSNANTRSTAITNYIRVETLSRYIPERSDPRRHLYFFAYRIRISNEGADTARLISRHWIITDGYGRVEEVRGEGVVGEQPRLVAGASHEYTSFCPLPTPWGAMRGSYLMRWDDGSEFEAKVARFVLLPEHFLN